MRIRFLFAGVCLAFSVERALADNWPSFRGPNASGVADGQELPLHWEVASMTNVRFKTAIPGLGHSSPIVWGDRVFVTSAVQSEAPKLELGSWIGIDLADEAVAHSWRLYCLDAATGRILWDAEAFSGPPRAKRHVKASQANATPATDGKTVVAIFGSEGVAAFDFEGRVRWRADLGKLDPGLLGDPASEWGHGSSPILFENRVLVQVDRHRDSYLAAFDLDTGRQLWRVRREERPVWATPTLVGSGERPELVVVGGLFVRGYDPRSGEELWRFQDEAEVKTPTPFLSDGLIVLSGGFRNRPIVALKPGGKGDLSVSNESGSGSHLAWRTEPGGPHSATPVAYRGLLYSVRDEGVLVAYDMAAGELVFRERTGASHTASLVASDGRIYVATEEGEILILEAGRAYRLLARKRMGESVMATPAIANRSLYIRTRGHVVAIAGATGAS